ncbi:MAG: PEPxxWA-CTERM sorting domain-containing protein [Alphaproteobacteria bacterium]|nr:PEPxxWA-CTERM sorting domain-containing protein [Alphaproteobacteria bacterium]MBU1513257.1 PEPxxWA-CTERM sorting domain-containing protein [Alphaproteobacteria bacterium]MBU2095365.1 PEPxxWA-CTERM sorting domain-containing protein [Alphaproteobacteria bacterium]MBU2152280.1 PEPxxWA-CTERM sorting domain-containing protein [Alphaproteobacteria bacterium]MBU2306673.1 PEPxxWA-CTERM sorting domain-containing protein [Alphaproteobacteria bacterium]
MFRSIISTALIAAATAMVSASPAAASTTMLGAPGYSEAVYGTPEAPLVWEGPSVEGTTLIIFRFGQLLNPEFNFKIRNATPGGGVSLSPYGANIIGFVDDDGNFSSGWVPAFATGLGLGYDILAVGELWAGGAPKTQSFDFYDWQVRGTQAPAIPEPSTWALMILGLGGAGTMLRRTRVLATS